MKRRRVTKACDYCHHRSIRCKRSEQDAERRCTNCVDFDQSCTFTRAVKRRGTKPRDRAPSTTDHADSIDVGQLQDVQSHQDETPVWRAPHIADHATIIDLVDIYFELVYPIFPFFHQPSFTRRIARAEYQKQQPLFHVTMAICALSSARVRDKAVYNSSWDLQQLSIPPSEHFYKAARDSIPFNDMPVPGLDLMRTYALLALTAIQYGNIRHLSAFLGRYHTLIEMDGLHDEENWPASIGIIETEERRRLFWSMYTLDVFSAVVWWDRCSIRVHEQQYNVRYPTELDDIYINDSGYRLEPTSPVSDQSGPSPSTNDSPNWLRGWNMTTDLWRILEHAVVKFQGNTTSTRSLLENSSGATDHVPATAMQSYADQLYSHLPAHFKTTIELTCDASRDRYGFQAANITATVQLLRMVLLAHESNSIEQRCKVVSEVVDAFMRVPVGYLRAISSPLLHHLAAIGTVLRGVLTEPFNEYQYHEVRTVLLCLAQLLENISFGFHSGVVAQKLRGLVRRIDVQMNIMTNSPLNLDESMLQSQAQDITTPRSQVRHNSYTEQGLPIQISSDILADWPWGGNSAYNTGY